MTRHALDLALAAARLTKRLGVRDVELIAAELSRAWDEIDRLRAELTAAKGEATETLQEVLAIGRNSAV